MRKEYFDNSLLTALFKALLMSVGLFSILPVPKNHWEERFLPWVIPLMPLVGGLIGLLWYAVAMLGALPTSGSVSPLYTALIMLTPFVLSGFFHLDGFMDTADAVFSRRDLEEKKRILKDSHVGAFAVIALACLFLVQYCAVETILVDRKSFFPLLFLPIVSRCVVAFLLLKMKPMSESGLAVMVQQQTGRVHRAVPIVVLAVVFPIAFHFGGVAAVSAMVVEAALAAGMMVYLQRQFGGISGDLCGCSITSGEWAGLLAVALWPFR